MDHGPTPDAGRTSGAAATPTVLTLYAQGWSIRRISAELSMSRPSVRRVLERAGIAVTPGGGGRARAWTRIECPDDIADKLRRLYVEEGMTRREVAEVLADVVRVSAQLVSAEVRDGLACAWHQSSTPWADWSS